MSIEQITESSPCDSGNSKRETVAVGSLALILLILPSAWFWNTYFRFEPDKIESYGPLAADVVSAKEFLAPGSSGNNRLDITLEGKRATFRVSEGYAAYFRRTDFFNDIHIGDKIEVWGLKSAIAASEKADGPKIIQVRVLKAGGKTYYGFSDYVAFQESNNRWVLAGATILSLLALIVGFGLSKAARGSSLNSEPAHPDALRFLGQGSDIFSRRGAILILSALSIVGMPIFQVYFDRWVSDRTRTSKGIKFVFRGTISQAYGLIILVLILDSLPRALPLNGWYSKLGDGKALWAAMIAVGLLSHAVQGIGSYLQFRYLFDNLRLSDDRKLNLAVPIWKFLLFHLISILAFFTIIGWAWWWTWGLRWLANRVTAEGIRFRFVGTGFEGLWRTIAAITASLLIVTIPWTISWYTRWYISAFTATEAEDPTDSSDASFAEDRSPLASPGH